MDFESFGNLNKREINTIGLAFMKKLEELTKKKLYYTVMPIQQVVFGKEK